MAKRKNAMSDAAKKRALEKKAARQLARQAKRESRPGKWPPLFTGDL